ncbi:FG-GAP repeat domain-containing protein [Streptomyces sp. NPDC101062]|uniref:FG-GAP repeat domain-containing protein n=1 Tax=unclassified Streptomyces TaxID=2593676 RepID=UPI00380DF751
MSTPARPRARWHRRITLPAALTCATVLTGGVLAGPASAAEAEGGPQGTVTLPAPSADDRPAFTVPDRGSAKAKAKGAGSARAGAARAAVNRADFNGDGFGEIVYRTNYGSVWVDWSTGGAEVISEDDSEVKDLLLPGDLTGDGRPDLLTLSPTGALRLHNGANATTDGGMTSYTTLSTGWQAYNKLFVPGDLNGDGKPDLLARSAAGLFLFPGTGTGFGAGIQVGGAGWSQFDQLIGVDDVDGDGLADILVRNATGLYLYPGNGSVTAYPFKDRIQLGGTGWLQYNQIVGGADLSGNGTTDLVARSYDGTLYYYEGNGDGTLAARETIGENWGTLTQLAGTGNPPFFGKDGVFARTPNGDLFYYFATGTGRLSERYLVGEGWDPADSRLTHSVSLRANGISDLIEHSTYDGALYNTGLYAVDNPQIAGGSKAYNLVIGPGDLDGDGKSDLLSRSSTALYFNAGSGNGLSVKARVQVGGSGWMQFNTIVGAGDLTGDGRADLVARSSEGLFLYAGTGDASAPFGPKTQVGGAGWGQYNKLTAPGDLNGDGRADLLASNTAGELYFYAGTGTAATPFKDRVKIGSGGWNQYADLV